MSPDEYIDSARKISRGLQSIYKSIRVETNRGARMVDITRVYIPSKLRFGKNSSIFQTNIIAPNTKQYRSHESLLIEYKDFCRSFQRVIVLGDPGGGKSTLCQYLCYELSKMLLMDSSRTSGESQLQKIPVRVVLRAFEKARKAEPQLDVFSFICREIRNATTLASERIEQSLQRALEFGHVVLAFDGLDEILDTSLRRDFVELVVGFCDQFPLCPVCVTSRLVGYEEARLPEVFEEIYLECFDDREVRQYVEKFLRVVANHTVKESQDGAAEFLAQTEANAHDLRQNPLLLGLMAWLFYMKGDVSTNRPEIYSECAILMFERWDQRRGIEARIPSDFDMLHLFSQLAAKIYGNSELEDGVDRAWLRREVRGYFEGQYEDRAKAHSASTALVDFITGRAWVMSEVGQDVFRFTHRTFLEYFFARHLDELHEGVGELLRILKERILRGEWDVVCHLSLQLKTYRRPRRVTEAITALQDLLRQSVRRSTRQQASGLRFAASALEYLPGSESEVRSLVSDVYAVAVRLGASASKEALGAVGAACHCSKERRELAQTLISDLLSDSVRRGAPEEVSFACTVLSNFFDDSGRSLPEEVRGPALASIKDGMLVKAVDDPFLACMYWEWYGEHFEQLFPVHGFKMFMSDRRWSGLYLRHPFRYRASLPNLVFQAYRGEGLEEEARHQFRVIGKSFIDAPQVEVPPKIPAKDWGMLHAPSGMTQS